MRRATLYIFRHGETDWNREERFQGHIDVPLNERGREQARAVADQLEDAGVQAILSSDLSRALETAQIVAGKLGIPVIQDPRLREANLGKAQGLTRQEIVSAFGEELAIRWRSSHVSDADISYPDGETGTQIIARSFEAVEEFLKLQTDIHFAGVACHGGVIRRIMQKLLPPGSPAVAIPNGVIYGLSFERSTGRWEVLPQKT